MGGQGRRGAVQRSRGLAQRSTGRASGFSCRRLIRQWVARQVRRPESARSGRAARGKTRGRSTGRAVRYSADVGGTPRAVPFVTVTNECSDPRVIARHTPSRSKRLRARHRMAAACLHDLHSTTNGDECEIASPQTLEARTRRSIERDGCNAPVALGLGEQLRPFSGSRALPRETLTCSTPRTACNR